ncbi:DUF4277 domain-containing protein [Streptomyces sp. SYSU K217416]
MVTSVVEKCLGALPVAAEFLRRLDVAGIVDELCPGGANSRLTHGQVIEALVAYRLTSPAPLVRVGDWARTWAVEEVFGITPDLLNDDRLARALKTMADLYPDKRRVRPTGRMILYHLGELTLRIGNVTDRTTVQINRGVQLHLLDLLDTDITQARFPQT